LKLFKHDFNIYSQKTGKTDKRKNWLSYIKFFLASSCCV